MKTIILSILFSLFACVLLAEEYKVTAFKNVQPPIEPGGRKGFIILVKPQLDLKKTKIQWETLKKEIPKWDWENQNQNTYIRVQNDLSLPFKVIINGHKVEISKIELVH